MFYLKSIGKIAQTLPRSKCLSGHKVPRDVPHYPLAMFGVLGSESPNAVWNIMLFLSLQRHSQSSDAWLFLKSLAKFFGKLDSFYFNRRSR